MTYEAGALKVAPLILIISALMVVHDLVGRVSLVERVVNLAALSWSGYWCWRLARGTT